MTKVFAFSVGDAVTFTNDYGVVFPGRKIVRLDHSTWWHDPQPRYFIEPTDSPWFSVAECNLTPAAPATAKEG